MKHDELTKRFASVDPKTLEIAGDAAKTFRGLAGVDTRALFEATGALRSVESMSKLFDVADLRKTAESLGMLRLNVAPQIAESLAAIDFGKRFADSFPRMEPPAFKFLSLADVGLGKQLATAFHTTDLMTVFGPRLDDLAQSLPRTFPDTIPPSFIPRVQAAAEEAVILAADDEEVAEIVDDASLEGFEGLTPEQRRTLTLDVAVLIAALLVLAVWLAESGHPRDPKGAAIVLTCVAALVRVFWRATGKI